MTEGVCHDTRKNISDEEDADEPTGGRPGPSDQGREGGLATRENAREITTADDAVEPPD